MITRTYSELIKIGNYLERFRYLRLDGKVSQETFGFDRYLNQLFYQSAEWRIVRDHVIARDFGNDLAMDGYPIYGKIYIHHMNPLRKADLINGGEVLFDPEFLVCVSLDTHNAIHYGDESKLFHGLVERTPNDTCPWKC